MGGNIIVSRDRWDSAVRFVKRDRLSLDIMETSPFGDIPATRGIGRFGNRSKIGSVY